MEKKNWYMKNWYILSLAIAFVFFVIAACSEDIYLVLLLTISYIYALLAVVNVRTGKTILEELKELNEKYPLLAKIVFTLLCLPILFLAWFLLQPLLAKIVFTLLWLSILFLAWFLLQLS